MRTGRPSTLAEVAARAGVSLTTASKAINGQARVSDATRARVLQAARELTYTPNPMARSLVSGRSGTVGMIIVDSVSQRWAVPIMLGAEEALSQIDLTMIISDARGDRARLQHIVDRFRERKVDGVLVLGDNNVRTPVLAPRLDRPTVYVYGETGGRDVVHVPDDAAGGALVAEHVLALGRRRVASVTGPEGARAAVQRSAGMQQALDAAGLALVAPASTKATSNLGSSSDGWTSMTGANGEAWARLWNASIVQTRPASTRDAARPAPGALARRTNAPKSSTLPSGYAMATSMPRIGPRAAAKLGSIRNTQDSNPTPTVRIALSKSAVGRRSGPRLRANNNSPVATSGYVAR